MFSFKRVILFLFVVILLFAVHSFVSTGYFRKINPQFDGKLIKKINITGAEDMMVSHTDSFLLISSTYRRKVQATKETNDGLYLIDLKDKNYTPIPLTTTFNQPFSPHGISYFKKDSSYKVMAINHVGDVHTIEVFELRNKVLTHLKTLKDPAIMSPNDLVMLDENRFYFTNDHGYPKGFGKLVEEYSGLALSNVIYYDGTQYREVADGIAYANGINYDKQRNLLYVASPRHFLVKVYSIKPDGSLLFIEDIPCGTGVDNIELDQAGNLWIGAQPNLLGFNAYAKGKKEFAPSEIIKIEYKNKANFSIELIYLDDGQQMSASTVAIPFGNLIFTGNVTDDHFLILERN